MNEYYNPKQAMERLGITSVTAFYQLRRKYPEAFVLLKSNEPFRRIRYDKTILDEFIERREQFIEEKPLQNDYYTFKEAMERLGMRSVNGFRHLQRKYPQVFVNLNKNSQGKKCPWYDKAAVDALATSLEYMKQDKR